MKYIDIVTPLQYIITDDEYQIKKGTSPQSYFLTKATSHWLKCKQKIHGGDPKTAFSLGFLV